MQNNRNVQDLNEKCEHNGNVIIHGTNEKKKDRDRDSLKRYRNNRVHKKFVKNLINDQINSWEIIKMFRPKATQQRKMQIIVPKAKQNQINSRKKMM